MRPSTPSWPVTGSQRSISARRPPNQRRLARPLQCRRSRRRWFRRPRLRVRRLGEARIPPVGALPALFIVRLGADEDAGWLWRHAGSGMTTEREADDEVVVPLGWCNSPAHLFVGAQPVAAGLDLGPALAPFR